MTHSVFLKFLIQFILIVYRDRSLSSNQWQVFAGGSVFTPDETSRMQTYEVRSIVAHPQARFNRFLYEQDVALVRVSRPLELNGHVVGAICLTSRAIEPRQLCVTAGWGYNSRNSSKFNYHIHLNIFS
jgi:hypothetical protein